MIKAVVAHAPRDLILSILTNTMEIQACGGMSLGEGYDEEDEAKVMHGADSAKMKTAGGTFFTLIKKHPLFTPEMKRRVFKCDRDIYKEKKRTMKAVGSIDLNNGETTEFIEHDPALEGTWDWKLDGVTKSGSITLRP